MTKPTLAHHTTRNFPLQPADVRQQALDRLYERRATVEALIESLEAYARCRGTAPVLTITRMPIRRAETPSLTLVTQNGTR